MQTYFLFITALITSWVPAVLAMEPEQQKALVQRLEVCIKKHDAQGFVAVPEQEKLSCENVALLSAQNAAMFKDLIERHNQQTVIGRFFMNLNAKIDAHKDIGTSLCALQAQHLIKQQEKMAQLQAERARLMAKCECSMAVVTVLENIAKKQQSMSMPE